MKTTCLLSLLCNSAHFLPCHQGPAVEVEHRLGLAPLASLFLLECRVGEYCGNLVLTPPSLVKQQFISSPSLQKRELFNLVMVDITRTAVEVNSD